LIGATANTPLPCTPDKRTWMRRPLALEEAGEGALAAAACVIGFFGYIEIMGVRACVRAREKPGLY
jgi:hypothetical protein